MKNWLTILLLPFIYSCEKDKVSFEYNALDPESGQRVLFLDSARVFISGSNNYVVGYYHIDKSKLYYPGGITAIGNYRNGTLIQRLPYPELSSGVFFDFLQLPAGNYTYNLRFLNAENEAGLVSNSITIARP